MVEIRLNKLNYYSENLSSTLVSDKKTVRKSSLKNWAFGCISRTREENQHPCLPPTKPKQLFGAPLEDVCDNDTLPTPILVGLILVSVTFLRRGVLRDQVFSSKSTPKWRSLALSDKIHNITSKNKIWFRYCRVRRQVQDEKILSSIPLISTKTHLYQLKPVNMDPVS